MRELTARMDLPEGVCCPSQLRLPDSDACFSVAFHQLVSDVSKHTSIKRTKHWSYGSAYHGVLKIAQSLKAA